MSSSSDSDPVGSPERPLPSRNTGPSVSEGQPSAHNSETNSAHRADIHQHLPQNTPDRPVPAVGGAGPVNGQYYYSYFNYLTPPYPCAPGSLIPGWSFPVAPTTPGGSVSSASGPSSPEQLKAVLLQVVDHLHTVPPGALDRFVWDLARATGVFGKSWFPCQIVFIIILLL